ncbi:MAG: response regulator [Gammaproteobacteria bacterium]|nr:response regulator [Gammaproteobacteria bacterium]
MLLSDLSIILVEPSTTQQKIIVGHLKEAGTNKIEAVSTGREALELVKRHIPDLVISAMYLPDMTGAELVKALRHDKRAEEVLFMLVSSETHLEYLELARQCGVIAILPKPFTHGDLKTALNATLCHIDPEQLELKDLVLEELNVLIVDDSMASRRYIRSLLSGMGITRFTEAVDGREAVECIDNTFFDLVITDYNMPNMDGRELVSYIREKSTQSSIPVLMLTTERDGARLAAVRHSGVSAICDKPFQQQNIKEIIESIMML